MFIIKMQERRSPLIIVVIGHRRSKTAKIIWGGESRREELERTQKDLEAELTEVSLYHAREDFLTLMDVPRL